MKISGIDPIIEPKLSWENIHKFSNSEASPCTSFATYDFDIASVGEDGCINLMNAQSQDVFRKIENADSCSIHCVIFLKHSQLLTSNLRGQMKVWDIRSAGNEPVSTFMLSGEQVSPTCLQFHPTQRHLVVAGDEAGTYYFLYFEFLKVIIYLGSVTIWDLRQNTYPVNLLDAHEGMVLDLQFHPDHPDHLFSCSSSGDIWHWAPKMQPAPIIGLDSVESNVWLASEAIKNKLDVFNLMPKLHKPVNCLDLNRNKVLCGCDNEAIYLINGINLFNS